MSRQCGTLLSLTRARVQNSARLNDQFLYTSSYAKIPLSAVLPFRNTAEGSDVIMEVLLTPVRTLASTSESLVPEQQFGTAIEDALTEAPLSNRPVSRQHNLPETPEQALELLKGEPDYENLVNTLKYLLYHATNFDLACPSPLAAQLVHVLVSEIVPNYWNVLRTKTHDKKYTGKFEERVKNSSDQELLVLCLRSVPGLNAILLNLRQYVQLSKSSKNASHAPASKEGIETLLQVLQSVMKGDEMAYNTWQSIIEMPETTLRRKDVWNDFISLISAKLVGLAAEAEDIILKLDAKATRSFWIANSSLYSAWIAQNITFWVTSNSKDLDPAWKGCSELLRKSFRLGHTGIHF